MSSFLARRAAIAAPRAAAASFSTTASRPLARISLIGRLADTPEVHATSTGRELVKYAVATNHGPKDNRKTSWFRVTSFEPEGPRRDFLQNLQKGSLVFVEGDAAMNSYEDSEGKTRTSLDIIQRHIEVLKRPYHEGDAQ